MRSYNTKDKPRPAPVTVEVDGRVLTFTSPGYAPFLFMSQDFDDPAKAILTTRAILDWLGAGLSEEDGAWILSRLQDPEDPFDIEDATDIIHGLLEDLAARPTTPSSVSLLSPAATASTDGRHLAESTPQVLVSADSATSPTTT